MDPLTHAATGALGGRALRETLPADRGLLFCIVAAVIPDIDNLAGLLNPELYLIHHRGITHSFAGGLVVALLTALAFRFFSGAFPLRRGFLIAYAAVISHILLDLGTSYGTQIFAPFSRRRYTVECVFIIDPFFTLALAAFLYASFRPGKRSRALAAAGLAWVVIYPAINLGIRASLQERLEDRLSREGVAYTRLHLSTDMLTPFFWKAILEEPLTYRLAGISLLEPEKPLLFQSFRRADPDLMEELGRRASFFKTYAWFAEYPVMEVRDAEGGRRITFGDLRFHSAFPWGRDLLRRGETAFSLTADLDKDGRLIAYEYRRPRGTKVIQHLE